MRISEINIYPIKSLKGISLEAALVEERGLRYDRRWMLTDVSGRFLTQREFPRMATIEVGVDDEALILSAEGFGRLELPLEPNTGDFQDVTIWQSVCSAEVYDGFVSKWFREVLGTACQLVYMPDDTRRNVNPRFNKNDDVVSFADGYPLMVLSEDSLDDLNNRLEEAHSDWQPAFRRLPMNRFRPNLVVSGSEAFAEDNWPRIRIGDAVFRSTKPCERCVITTVDQSRGSFDGKEPLRTLASFRMAKDVIPDRYESLGVGANAVLFGQNLIAESVGAVINVGDQIEVIE